MKSRKSYGARTSCAGGAANARMRTEITLDATDSRIKAQMKGQGQFDGAAWVTQFSCNPGELPFASSEAEVSNSVTSSINFTLNQPTTVVISASLYMLPLDLEISRMSATASWTISSNPIIAGGTSLTFSPLAVGDANPMFSQEDIYSGPNNIPLLPGNYALNIMYSSVGGEGVTVDIITGDEEYAASPASKFDLTADFLPAAAGIVGGGE